MYYSIGRVSEMFGLPVSTLRYYDKEGLFPNMERVSGIRKFSDKELETLRVIECLKKSGLEIKDIKQFMEWCSQGSSTYSKRRELFERQKEFPHRPPPYSDLFQYCFKCIFFRIHILITVQMLCLPTFLYVWCTYCNRRIYAFFIRKIQIRCQSNAITHFNHHIR